MAIRSSQFAVRNPQSAILLSPGYAVATSARKWAMSRLRLGIGMRITIPVHSSSLQFGCHLFLLALFFVFRKQFAQEELLKAAQHSAISGYLVASSPAECLFIPVDECLLATRAL